MEKKSKETHSFFKSVVVFIICIGMILTFVWVSLLQFHMPEVVSKEEKKNDFSAERAMEYVKQIAEKPHPVGSKGHDEVKDYIFSALENIGVSPKIQKEEGEFYAWGGPYKGKIENIVAKIPGVDSSKAIMLTAHYDSEGESLGASDDGSGVAAIIETVRIIKQEKKLKNDLIILISDGEEKGLLGAQQFVQKHPWAKDVGLVLNFEARGNSGPSILFETNKGNERVISEFAKSAPNPVAHSFLYSLYKIMPHDTDLTVYKKSGMYGMNFGFFEGLNSYHTAEDTVENLSLESLQHQGDYMLHLVKHFGSMELVAKEDNDKIFFNILGHKIITYSDSLVIPFLLLAIMLFGLTCMHGYKKKKLSVTGTSVGFLIFLGVAGMSYFLGDGIWNLLSIVSSGSLWSYETNLKISNPMFVGLIFLLIALISLIYSLISKKINAYNLSMGAFVCWLIIAVISSIWLKETSYIFVWPLIFGLGGLNISMRMKKEQMIWRHVIVTIFSMPAILIAVPAIFLIYVLITMSELKILLVSVSLVGAYLIPIFCSLKLKFKPVLPGILFVIGLCLLFSIKLLN